MQNDLSQVSGISMPLTLHKCLRDWLLCSFSGEDGNKKQSCHWVVQSAGSRVALRVALLDVM